MENKIQMAKDYAIRFYSDNELTISNCAVDILQNLNLDDTCILASYLYFPYCKIGVKEEGQVFSSKEEEEQQLKEIDKVRTAFKQELTDKFGENVVNFLHALKKLIEIDYQNQEEEAENIRKMFFALAKDIRVIIVKLCFVLAELKVLSGKANKELVEKKSKQTLELFAPLASRLGLSSIKSELEDLSFKNLYPQQYSNITTAVDRKYKERAITVENLKNEIRTFLADLSIKGEVMGRKKHIFSIYKKLKEKNGHLDKIYDLVAVRAIVATVEDCYALLGKINSNFIPLQNRFKDYISIPKSNGYQSLHTTVMFEGVPVEIQIRTTEMHRAAEFGVAAHWVYKEKRSKLDSLDERLGWIREIMENEKQMSSSELIESLKVDIYDGEIFVQSPKGKVLHLPEGASAIDFAYAIHSDVGNRCVGAKVNGKMQPITKPLENGDLVEIITNPNSKGPSRDWLKIVKTSGARSKIMQFFRKEMKNENIKAGKSMLEQAIKNLGYATNKILDKKYVEKYLEKGSYFSADELFASIGYGSSSAKIVAGKLVNIYLAEIKSQRKKEIVIREPSEIIKPKESSVDVLGVDNLMVKFANCCQPMEGDEIIGFISHGQGIVVHRKQCQHVAFLEPERLIDVNWKLK